jgi:hypothetical protein
MANTTGSRIGTIPTNGLNVILFNNTVTGAGNAGGAATVNGAGFGDPLNSANITLTSSGVTYPNVPNCAHVDGNYPVCWQYVNSTANAGLIN